MHHGGNIYATARRMGVRPEELIDFSANINPLGFPAGLSGLLRRARAEILNYPDPDALDCTAALARYHGLPRRCILPGNGSTELIYLLPDIIKPRNVLIVTPTFTEYGRSYQNRKVNISVFQTYMKNGFLPDRKRLCTRLRGFDAVYLCNPVNPSGSLMQRADMLEIVRSAHAHGVKVVLDEAFIDFAETHSMKNMVRKFDNLIILRSLTKFFGIPGLRFGYLIAHPDIVAAAAAQRPPWSVNALAQIAVPKLLKDRAFMDRTRSYVRRARERLVRGLEHIGGLKIMPGSANFLLVRLTAPHPTAIELFRKLLRHNIIIRTCEDFKGLDTRYFRIAVKRERENALLVRALKNILEKQTGIV